MIVRDEATDRVHTSGVATGTPAFLRSPKRQQGLRQGRTLSTFIATGVIFLLTIYFLFPIYWELVATTKSGHELPTTNGLVPAIPVKTWENIVSLLTVDSAIFGKWFINSFIYSGLGGIGCTIVSGAAGYALAMLRFRGAKLVTLAILVGTMVPGTVMAFPLFLVLVRLGLVDTYWAFLLPSLVSPLAVFLAKMFATQSIPYELLEAARLDGASELYIAFRIGFRLMRPGLVTILLIQVIAIWNNFFLPLIVLSSTELFPSTLGLYVWNSRITQSPEYQVLVLIGSLVSCIPLILLFLTLQRYWRSGLTAGAVKM